MDECAERVTRAISNRSNVVMISRDEDCAAGRIVVSESPNRAITIRRPAAISPEVDSVLRCGDKCDQVRHLVAESINRVSVGIAIISPAGQVLEINSLAREIVESGDVLVIEKGRISGLNAANEAALVDAIAKVTGTAAHAGCFIPLVRGPRKQALHAFVAPIHVNGDKRSTGAALFLSDPDRAVQTNEKLLTTLFSLSPAEARVASGIVEGLAVPELAARLHVSVHTVRTQLKSIFAKTGAQRQSDLVRLLTSGLALVSVEK